MGESVKRRVEAAEEFNRHQDRGDGTRVAGSLADGLMILRDSLYGRVHYDVQTAVGKDSMLIPISEKRSETVTKTEIDLYQIAESAAAAGDHGYVGTDADWYVQWLTRLELGEMQSDAGVVERLAQYLSQTPDDRRLAFTDVLASVLPESRRAPLVLFRLLPLCVQIATALAFGDQRSAAEARNRQVDYLPGIRDCHECGGSLLENGAQCRECGNPLWKFGWLTAAD